MVDIILVFEVRTVDIGKQLQCLSRVREQVARIFEAIDGLDDHAKSCLSSAISSPGEVLTYQVELCLAALIRKDVSDQGVELRASDLLGKFKGAPYVGAKPLLPTGIVEKP